MPRPTLYDPSIRKTEHGAKLYATWKQMRTRNLPYDPAWEAFPEFYAWAMREGYQAGAFLSRYDKTVPHGPGNSYWHPVEPKEENSQTWANEWCAKWDETVNKLRKQLGLPPLGG